MPLTKWRKKICMEASAETRNQLKDLAVQLVEAHIQGDQTTVEAMHQRMHDLDPKGREFECENCPLNR